MDSVTRHYIGAQQSSGNRHEVSYAREVPEQEHLEIRDDFRFLRELAQQNEFMRLVQCVQAWDGLIHEVVEEGAEDGLISAASQHKARRGLRAVFQLTDELVIAAERRIQPQNPEDHIAQTIDDFRGTEAFAQLDKLDRLARSGEDLLGVTPVGALKFVDAEGGDARGLPVSVLGYAGGVIPAVLAASAVRFGETAKRVRTLGGEVGEGAPMLIEAREDPESDELRAASLQPLPLRDIAILESAYRQPDAQSAMRVLMENRERSAVYFAYANADMAVRGVRASGGINRFPRASFELKLDLIGPDPIDYWAPVTFRKDEGGWEEEMFAGTVEKAVAEDDAASLECEGGGTVLEHTKGGVIAANISGGDLIRSLNAQSGWKGELLLNEDVGEQASEEFEVVVPVAGLQVGDTSQVGAVELISSQAGQEILQKLDLGREDRGFPILRERFLAGEAHARVTLISQTLNEAEDKGVEMIETAIAWLTARGRYGTALLPDDSGLNFDRESALVSPEIGPVVLVRGKTTERQWLRWWHGPLAEMQEHRADVPDSVTPTLPASVPIAVRQALLALQTAVAQRDPYAQAIGVWQAIEALAAKTKCRRLFSSEELKELREAMPTGLNAEQREVIAETIGRLNEPPVRERMVQRLRRDGIPISDQELALLDQLRKARNAAVHGRERTKPPTREEINYGIGIVSRMLVFRVSQLGDT
jgi:hypothetical protein